MIFKNVYYSSIGTYSGAAVRDVNVGVGDLAGERWRWCRPVKDYVHGFVPPPRPHPEPVAEHRPPNEKVRLLCGSGGEQEVIPVNEDRHLRTP